MSAIIALVSAQIVPFLIALAGLSMPLVGYLLERQHAADAQRCRAIALRVWLSEICFFAAWELGIYLWWSR